MGLKGIFSKKGSATSSQRSTSTPPSTFPQTEGNGADSLFQSQLTPHNSSRSTVRSSPSPPNVSRQNSNASSVISLSSTSSEHGGLTRIISLPGGRHSHQLKNARRQEKLGRMLREMMGSGQRVGNNAVSAVPDFIRQADVPSESNRLSLMHGLVNRLANGEVELGRVNGSSDQYKRFSNAHESYDGPNFKETSQKSLSQKYGRCQEVIGRGSYGVVRVYHKMTSEGEQLYAVKEFRKRSSESNETYQDRLMSEFCISSSLDHLNIIHTFDLMKDSNGECCQIMEYCSGGDLYSLVLSAGQGLTVAEADCFFKQILRGVVYMHSMGVAHCDIKPENILLTQSGVCKISDFGNGECFRMAWEKDVHYSQGICGSGPYIAPEEFKGKSFDPRAVDIWALGIVYMVMRTGSYLWRKAVAEEDDHYAKYVRARKTTKGYSPVERLAPSKCVYVIYSILDPVPSRRITGKQILNSEWCRGIKVCEQAEKKTRLPKEQKAPMVDETPTPHTTKAC